MLGYTSIQIFHLFPYAEMGKNVDNPYEVDVLLVRWHQPAFSCLVENYILTKTSDAVVLSVQGVCSVFAYVDLTHALAYEWVAVLAFIIYPDEQTVVNYLIFCEKVCVFLNDL